MRYRTRTGKQLGDRAALSDISSGFGNAAKREAPILSQFVSGFFAYTIGSLAFLTKSFLRLKLGERTFGLFTIFFAFLLTYLVYYVYQLGDFTLATFYNEEERRNLGTIIWVFFEALLFLPFLLLDLDRSYTYVTEQGKEVFFSLNLALPDTINYFLIIIVIIGISHIVDVYLRRINREIIHSFHRGDSIFWGWLIGKKIGKIVLEDTFVWMIVEPLFVLSISYLIYSFLEGYNPLAFLLGLSAICLFIEEYKMYTESRRIRLDMRDGRLDAIYMSTEQEKDKESFEREKESSAKSYHASVGGTVVGSQEARGSTSKFRAKLL